MNKITVETVVKADINKVWSYWTTPEHVQKWNYASEDWECPKATNDLQVGSEFHYTMSAKDGSVSFDFAGTYTEITPLSSIAYTLGDERKVTVQMAAEGDSIHIVETFDPENENSEEMQRFGWQAILDNFKKYTEGS